MAVKMLLKGLVQYVHCVCNYYTDLK